MYTEYNNHSHPCRNDLLFIYYIFNYYLSIYLSMQQKTLITQYIIFCLSGMLVVIVLLLIAIVVVAVWPV